MYWLTILHAARRGILGGLGGRLGRSLRDGCVAMTVFVVAAYGTADLAPESALRGLALMTGMEPGDPLAVAFARVQLFGGYVLQGTETAKLVAVGSLVVRTTVSAVRAVRAALKPAPEVTHG